MARGYTRICKKMSWESGLQIKPHAKGLFTILINLQFIFLINSEFIISSWQEIKRIYNN